MEKLDVPSNILRTNKMSLDLSIDEAVYLVGSLRIALKQMRAGDQLEITRRVLQRLEDSYLQLQSYLSNVPL